MDGHEIQHPAPHRRRPHAYPSYHGRAGASAGVPEVRRRPLFRALHALNRAYCEAYHSLAVHAPCTLPSSGPAILVSNHTSHIDPMLIQSACPDRVIVWMMTRDFYDIAAMRPLFELLECIPVSSSGKDMTAMRSAMRALNDGRVVGIFPEGRIERAGELLEFQTGVALMALRTGVPVCPVALEGTQRNTSVWQAAAQPHRVHLAFGDCFTPPARPTDRDALETTTDELRSRIGSLLAFVRTQTHRTI